MYIDFATICIYLFWFFFAALIIYLRREDKREGYPLESDRQGVTVQGFPAMPGPRAPLAPHPAAVGGMPVDIAEPTTGANPAYPDEPGGGTATVTEAPPAPTTTTEADVDLERRPPPPDIDTPPTETEEDDR
jgi:photosynthetic reaction center H subunit